jgi:iron complex transport system substrate-binding protein
MPETFWNKDTIDLFDLICERQRSNPNKILEKSCMKRLLSSLILVTIFCLALTACSPAVTATQASTAASPEATQTPETALATSAVPTVVVPTTPAESGPIQLTDGLGRKVTLSAPAKRIVSLAPSNTEALFAVGAGDQVIARDNFSNYPEQVPNLPSVGDSATGFDKEKIVSLQPDLVLAAGINSAEDVKAYEDLKLTVYYLPNPTNLEELYTNMKTVGKLSGHDAEAATLVQSLTDRADAVAKALSGAKDKPKVFYELDATDPAKPWTTGAGTFIDLLITLAGGQNVGASMQSEWAQISQEALIVANPDFILLGDANYGNVTPEQVDARPGWNVIKAVQDKHVQAFNDDLVSRPGPRMVDGLVAMAKILHPDLTGGLK